MSTYWLLAIATLVGFSALFGGIIAGAVCAYRGNRPFICAGFVVALVPAFYMLILVLGFLGFVPLNTH